MEESQDVYSTLRMARDFGATGKGFAANSITYWLHDLLQPVTLPV